MSGFLFIIGNNEILDVQAFFFFILISSFKVFKI